EGLRLFLEKRRKIREKGNRGRAQVMLNPFNIPALRARIQAEQREKSRQGLVPALNATGDFAPFRRQHQAAVALVVDVTLLAQSLNHTGDRGLADVQRFRNVDDAGIPLLFNQGMDALEVILGALSRSGGHYECANPTPRWSLAQATDEPLDHLPLHAGR